MTLLTSEIKKRDQSKASKARGLQVSQAAQEHEHKQNKEALSAWIKVQDEQASADDIPAGKGYITKARVESYFDQS